MSKLQGKALDTAIKELESYDSYEIYRKMRELLSQCKELVPSQVTEMSEAIQSTSNEQGKHVAEALSWLKALKAEQNV